MDFVFITQWLGTAGVVAFYPIQNWRLFLTRNPIGLSFFAFCLLSVGVAGYLALGLHLGLRGLAAGNAVNFFFVGVILTLLWFRSEALRLPERIAGLTVLLAGLGGLALVNLWGPGGFAEGFSGWLGLGGVVAFYPVQNFDLFRKKDPRGLSLLAFGVLAVGAAFYTLLGFLVRDVTVIIGNGFATLGALLTIYLILRYAIKDR